MSHFGNHHSDRQTRPERHPNLNLWAWTILVGLSGQVALAQGKVQGETADGPSRKFVNKIPYDVFFDNPLQVVNSNKNVTPAADTPAGKPGTPKPPPAAAAGSAKAGGIAWQELLPMEELQGEVKSVRNSLTKAMSNQGTFNTNFKSIAIDGAELAALAGIAQNHQESLSWKDKAQYVRDFGAQLNLSAVGLGKDNFEKTRSAYQKLSSVLDGSVPADAGDVPVTRPFHEAASRKGLMKRIEKARDWLKQDVNSEVKFKSMSAQILHEAGILSALATVITTTGYEYTENDDYQEHAKSLIEGARDAAAASKDDSWDKFKQAIDKVNKSCTDCHASYGNG
jgi:hypothetical protein